MVCEFCNIDHDGAYGSGRFCSDICARGFSRKSDNDKEQTKSATCIKCGRETLINKRCSNSKATCGDCVPKQQKIKHYQCIYCGDKLNNKQFKYCSAKCQVNNQHDESVSNWKNGISSGLIGGYHISKTIRKYLFIKYENKCSICGWGELNPHTGNIPLEVEHIDGDYENNSESNLTLLCPNCHSLTKTYKGANVGNGRHSRRIRYKIGKSY